MTNTITTAADDPVVHERVMNTGDDIEAGGRFRLG